MIVASGLEIVTVGPAALLFAGAAKTKGNTTNKINLYRKDIMAGMRPSGNSSDVSNFASLLGMLGDQGIDIECQASPQPSSDDLDGQV